jgi:pimeloyl-CoA synthetase
MSKTFQAKARTKISKLLNKRLETQEQFDFFKLIFEEMRASFTSMNDKQILSYLFKNKQMYAVLASEILRINKISKKQFYQL